MVEPLVDLTVDPVVVKLGLVVVVLFGMDGGSWWMRVPTGMTAHSGTEWMDRTARQWRPGLGQTVVPTEAFVGGDILFFAPIFLGNDTVTVKIFLGLRPKQGCPGRPPGPKQLCPGLKSVRGNSISAWTCRPHMGKTVTNKVVTVELGAALLV